MAGCRPRTTQQRSSQAAGTGRIRTRKVEAVTENVLLLRPVSPETSPKEDDDFRIVAEMLTVLGGGE
jgi:hypothetical protein